MLGSKLLDRLWLKAALAIAAIVVLGYNLMGRPPVSKFGLPYWSSSLEVHSNGTSAGTGAQFKFSTDKPVVTIGLAICGERLDESVVMMKSLIIFSRNVRLKVIAFQDNLTSPYLHNELEKLQGSAGRMGIEFTFETRDSWFPESDGDEKWRDWFAPCSTQRLFFPSLLPEVDKILHLDTDILILSDILDLWNHFEEMDKHKAIGAMEPEHNLPGDGWYSTKATIPYYGPRGLNAGVMLMNLEAMRQADWQNGILLVLAGFREHLMWADQDIMNVYFHFHKDWMHELPCDLNYMVQFCDPDQYNDNGLATNCTRAERNGISILHGNRGQFYLFEWSRIIFDTFQEHHLESDTPEKLLNQLIAKHLEYRDTRKPCSYLSIDIFKNFQRYLRNASWGNRLRIFL